MSTMAISRQPSSRLVSRCRTHKSRRCPSRMPRRQEKASPSTVSRRLCQPFRRQPNATSLSRTRNRPQRQLKRKQEGFDGSFHHALCSTLHNLGDSNRRRLGEDECNGDFSPSTASYPNHPVLSSECRLGCGTHHGRNRVVSTPPLGMAISGRNHRGTASRGFG